MMTPNDYEALYQNAILTGNPRDIDYAARVAIAHESLYRAVQLETKIPWQVVACIHFRESNQDFTKHLHNGDPLSSRTTHVPEGRPTTGEPPFSWQDSAIDALSGIWKPLAWNLAGWLEFMERYNGIGYQKHGINTPYLWDFTSQYTAGLFVADGSFNPVKTESRPGCVALLKGMLARGTTLDFLS